MTTYTPGPWRVGLYENTEGDCHKIQIERQDGNGLAPAYSWHSSSKERCLANAHLIAAAPEMYELLKTLFRYSDSNVYEIAGEQLERILAKAEGKV